MKPAPILLPLLLAACAGPAPTSPPGADGLERDGESAGDDAGSDNLDDGPVDGSEGEGEGESVGGGQVGEGEGESEGGGAPQNCAGESEVSGCAPDGDGDLACTLTHDGVERRYLLHVPAGEAQVARPVVFAFHGLRTTASLQRWISRMNEDADENGYVVVYPEGLGEDLLSQSFNAGLCCGYASDHDVDDVGFTLAILAHLREGLCIDAARVHATGLSNGGHMAYRLACEEAEVFASVASVAGVVTVLPCTPSRPVPVLHFHGTEDQVVRYGGYGGFAGAQATVEGWAERNGCDATAETTLVQGEVSCVAWPGCDASSAAELCTVEGGGHTWPGGEDFEALGHTTHDLSATARISAFFAAHPMP